MSASLSQQCHRLYPRRFAIWQEHGLSVRAASAVAVAGCDTVADIARLGHAYFEAQPNCGAKTLAELAALSGWEPDRRTAVDAIAAALSMSINLKETRDVATDVMIALRRSGFTIIASSAPGR